MTFLISQCVLGSSNIAIKLRYKALSPPDEKIRFNETFPCEASTGTGENKYLNVY